MTPDVEDALRCEFPTALREVQVIECGDGWRELIRECAGAAERASILLDGIKEKYGELRVGVQSGEMLANVLQAIESAEARSRTVCEVCGAAGELEVFEGWARTRCKPHHPKFRTASLKS